MGEHRYLSTVQRVENSPPVISCSPCGALPFDVNLCRNRRPHEENNIIWGSLCLRSWGFFWPSSPLISKQGTIFSPLVCHISLFTEKKYSSPFSPVHPEIHLPIPVYSYHISVLISYLHFHLNKSTVLYIYYDYTRFFFLLWMFLCCTPSYLVVYWLLSCGMFVLSQSNVVFTLKPHFS